jgi:hypothetical protein
MTPHDEGGRRELEEQNALAQELLATLEKIKAAWDDLPSEDEIESYAEKVGGIRHGLESAESAWADLPDQNEIQCYAENVNEIKHGLGSAQAAWDALPDEDEVKNYARQVGIRR